MADLVAPLRPSCCRERPLRGGRGLLSHGGASTRPTGEQIRDTVTGMMGTGFSSGDPWRPARREMVRAQLVARGIRDRRVLEAMTSLARERFIPVALQDQAYADRAVPIGYHQTISQPYIVARMTEALDVRPGLRILEVGTGCGYQTALLALLGARVVSIERIAELSVVAARTLADLGIEGPELQVGDGSVGCPSRAPFDRVIVAAAAPQVPESLIGQIRDGGRMVIPIGRGESQVLVVLRRMGGRVIETPVLPCRFVKLVGAEAW